MMHRCRQIAVLQARANRRCRSYQSVISASRALQRPDQHPQRAAVIRLASSAEPPCRKPSDLSPAEFSSLADETLESIQDAVEQALESSYGGEFDINLSVSVSNILRCCTLTCVLTITFALDLFFARTHSKGS
jgi:hypothetical protein